MTLVGARRAYLVYIGQEAAGSFWFMMVITATIRLHGRDLVVDEVVA